MKLIKLILSVVLIFSTWAGALTPVIFTPQDVGGNAEPGLRIRVTPRWTPGAIAGAHVGNDFFDAVTGTNGTVTTNIVAGIYDISYLWTNKTTSFRIEVPDTNVAQSASSLMTTNAIPGQTFLTSVSDGRYVRSSNGMAREVRLISTNSPAPAVGQVWTMVNTNGQGYWSAAGSGSGDVTTAQLNSASNVLRSFTLSTGQQNTNHANQKVASDFGLATNLQHEGTIHLLENGVDKFHIYTTGGNLQIEDESIPQIILNWDPVKRFWEFTPAITTGSSTNTGNSTTGGTNFAAYFSGNGSLLTGLPGGGDVTTAQLTTASNNLFFEITNRITITSNGLIVYMVGESNALSARLVATNTALLSVIAAQGTALTNLANTKVSTNNGAAYGLALRGTTAITGVQGTNGFQFGFSGTTATLSDVYSANTLWSWDTLSMIWDFNPSARFETGITNVGDYWGPQVNARIVATNVTASRILVSDANKLVTNSGIAVANGTNLTGAGAITSGDLITATNFQASGVTASRATYFDSLKRLTSSAASNTELDFLAGVTSAIQTQLDAKFSLTAGNGVSNAVLNTSNQLVTAIAAQNAASNALVIVSNTVPNKVAATNGQAYGLTLNGVTTNAGAFYNVQSNLVYTGTAGVNQTNIHIDFSFGNEFYLLLTNNAFLIPTNMRPAQVVNIEIWQDATGSRSVAWQGTVTTNAGGLALTNTANARNVITMKAGKYATNVFAVSQPGFQ